jgi:predicted ATP-grasp superfamily ATP-dependent carboligase
MVSATPLHPAFVLGMGMTGLAVARSLGRRGVPVWGFDYEKDQIGFTSRFCRQETSPPPRECPEALIDFLLCRAEGMVAKPVLMPTSDEFLITISNHREKLGESFLLNLPEESVIERINNKRQFHAMTQQHGIPAPNTYFPENHEELARISEKVGYPCIIKGIHSFLYTDVFTKALKIENAGELKSIYERHFSSSKDVIVQEIISGPDDQQYSVGSYLNRESKPIAVFTTRKIRQRPVEFGVGTYYETCHVPMLAELSMAFLQEVGYQGLSEIGYKFDSKDQSYKIIEINTRPWIQVAHAFPTGIDFPLIAYQEMTGQTVQPVRSRQGRAKWISLEDDFFAVFGKTGYLSRREIGLREWIGSLIGKKAYAIFAFDDLKPTAVVLSGFLSRMLERLRGGDG